MSYATGDRAVAVALKMVLEHAGATVFMDCVSIPLGARWERVLTDELAKADTLWVIWSARARRSKWVRREYITFTTTFADRDCVPLALAGAPPLPAVLAKYQSPPALTAFGSAVAGLANDADFADASKQERDRRVQQSAARHGQTLTNVQAAQLATIIGGSMSMGVLFADLFRSLAARIVAVMAALAAVSAVGWHTCARDRGDEGVRAPSSSDRAPRHGADDAGTPPKEGLAGGSAAPAPDHGRLGTAAPVAPVGGSEAMALPEPPGVVGPRCGAETRTPHPWFIVTPMDDSVAAIDFQIFSGPSEDELFTYQDAVAAYDGGARWQPTRSLEENTHYYWRVRSRTSAGAAGSWSTPLCGIFENEVDEPPTAPVAAAPVGGATTESATPLLTVVNANDPDEDVLVYDFEVYEDAALTKLLFALRRRPAGIETTSAMFSVAFSPGSTYYWRAQATDPEGLEGPWSETASFTVSATAH